MRAVEVWREIEEGLGTDWDEASFSFTVEDRGAIAAAAAVLAPLGPGRSGNELRFQIQRQGGGPEKLRNLLGRLDQKRVWGTLALVDTRAEAPVAATEPEKRSLTESWDAAVSELPPGWSDILGELEIESTDLLPRAALLGAPLNPTRNPDAIALRFRVSNGEGYGASTGMARRCLERMDAEGITGRVRVLQGLSDTENVATQGPIWRIAGRSV